MANGNRSNGYVWPSELRIRGIDGLAPAELQREIEAGGRFVFYEYCISLLVVSLRRPTDIYFLRPRQYGVVRGLPYVLVSVLLGWWGIPWGLIYTPLTLITNLSGGCDVTEQAMSYLNELSSAPNGEPGCVSARR
jgi:hypothetical protein